VNTTDSVTRQTDSSGDITLTLSNGGTTDATITITTAGIVTIDDPNKVAVSLSLDYLDGHGDRDVGGANIITAPAPPPPPPPPTPKDSAPLSGAATPADAASTGDGSFGTLVTAATGTYTFTVTGAFGVATSPAATAADTTTGVDQIVNGAPTDHVLAWTGPNQTYTGVAGDLNTLQVSTVGNSIDLTNPNTHISNLQAFDLTGAQNSANSANGNSLTLNPDAVFSANAHHQITILGNGNDTVNLNASSSHWTQVTSQQPGYDEFASMSHGQQVLVLIQHTLEQAHHVHAH